MDSFKLSRRTLLKATGATACSVSLPFSVSAKEKTSENFVKDFYSSLSAKQKKVMAFPWDHKKRSYISNNWDVVDPDYYSVGEFYNSSQQKLIFNIFKGLLSADGVKNYSIQMKDDGGGFENFTCAVFGNPSTDKFEWVFTGRHLTLRADGNSTPNTSFGGPFFYGHAPKFRETAKHPGNVWWHQAVLANELYKSLDSTQKKAALLDDAPGDHHNSAKLRTEGFAGLKASSMTVEQKAKLEKTINSLLASYRKTDVDEALTYLKSQGGLDALHVAFYEEGDIGEDQVWDRWRIEGPGFVWYYRGSPHVHSWVNIGSIS